MLPCQRGRSAVWSSTLPVRASSAWSGSTSVSLSLVGEAGGKVGSLPTLAGYKSATPFRFRGFCLRWRCCEKGDPDIPLALWQTLPEFVLCLGGNWIMRERLCVVICPTLCSLRRASWLPASPGDAGDKEHIFLAGRFQDETLILGALKL